MTQPIKFKIISRQEIEDIAKPPAGWLNEYLRTRPDILEKIDIWCPNSRSAKQEDYCNFHLFDQTDKVDSSTVFVFSIYLELFEFNNMQVQMYNCIDHFCKKYPNNLIVFHWNHDNDWALHGWIMEKYKNAWVVNFGYTSKKHKRNIIVPFWNINTDVVEENKKYFASFIGTPNNNIRAKLANHIMQSGKDTFHYLSGLDKEQYYKAVSSSVFSLCPQGGPSDGGFSYRFFECLHLNTVPVILVNRLVFPYDSEINYDDVCLRFPVSLIDRGINNLEKYLISNQSRVDQMLKNISSVRHKFTLGGVQQEVYKNISKQVRQH
tara:strand:- start:16845 stop:17807 length:963 start_codon:yes stop_codon:yes gene_type:complete